MSKGKGKRATRRKPAEAGAAVEGAPVEGAPAHEDEAAGAVEEQGAAEAPAAGGVEADAAAEPPALAQGAQDAAAQAEAPAVPQFPEEPANTEAASERPAMEAVAEAPAVLEPVAEVPAVAGPVAEAPAAETFEAAKVAEPVAVVEEIPAPAVREVAAPAPEPEPVVVAAPTPVPVAAEGATARRLDDVITPEDAPAPKPARPAPRLRLLRLDGNGPLEERINSALGTVEQVAGPAATAAGEELRKAMAFLAGQLDSAEAKSVARNILSRLGQLVAAAQAPAGGEVDEFGRDPVLEERALRALSFFYKAWFRVTVRGIQNVPAEGPVILVANHSGALPWDAAMLKCALAFEHPAKRVLRPLAENLTFHYPFLGVFLNRFGAVRACQENAEALLARGEAVAVFPEGIKGIGKSFRKRYRLQRFGRGGFVKLALRTGAPVVPVAIVGAEESHPLLGRMVRPVAPLGLAYLPVTPTFPLLGVLGLVPLPTKWTIEFGAPVQLEGPGRADDELTVQKLAEDVRGDIQTRLDRLVAGRRGVFF